VVTVSSTNKTTTSEEKPEKRRGKSVLDCGRPVASTVVDSLPSITNRHSYPHVPEPEVAVIFRTKGSTEVDMNQLEMQLRAAKKEVSVVLFVSVVQNILCFSCEIPHIVFFFALQLLKQ